MFRKTLMILALLCAVTHGVFAQTEGNTQENNLSGSGTVEDPYLIGSVEDWCTLADNVAAGNRYDQEMFKMTADIDLGDLQVMIGSEANPFGGNFDGQGHTLTIHYVTDEDFCAPFRCILENQITIKSLHVTGTINTSGKYAGGVIGTEKYNGPYCYMPVFAYLWSSVVITSTVEGEGYHGGIAGRIQAQPYFRNCLFDGSLLGPNTTSCGGMVGNFNANFLCYFQSCLYAPEEQTVLDEGSAIFAVIGYPGGTIYTIGWDYWPGDSYYKRTLGDGDAQGVDASEMDIDELWSKLGGEWQLVDGKLIPQFPIARPLTGSGTQEDPYIISSADDWTVLKYNLMAGCDYIEKYFLQTNSFTTSEMVGTMHYPFTGKYDGGGNTITFNVGSEDHPVKQDYQAPFRYVQKNDKNPDVSISNLHTDGHIYTAAKFAGGLIAYDRGEAHINNCRSSITIHSSVDGDGTHGGFAAFIESYRGAQTFYFTGCVFDGSLLGDKTTNCAGFVGWTGMDISKIKVHLIDCFLNPKKMECKESKNFVRPGGNWVTSERCYQTFDYGYTTFYPVGRMVHRLWSDIEGLSFYDSELRATYNTSDIKLYDNSISFGDTYYAVKGSVMNIVYPLQGYRFTCEGNDASISGKRVTMGSSDTKVSMELIDWAESQGTEEDPYIIQNTEQMDMLAQRVNENTSQHYEGKYFELAADLEYDGTENNYTPVGYGSGPSCNFGGVFDGKGHSISGIHINIDNSRQALFGVITGGTVKNLTLKNSTISGRGDGHGAIVGYLMGNGTLENCHVASTVNVSGTNYAGGVVGANMHGTISNCSSGASVSGNTNVGGIVGACGRNTSVEINCVVKNNIYFGTSVTGSTSGNVGAISGNNSEESNNNFKYANNYYTAVDVKGVKGADVTENDGALPGLRDDADNTSALELLKAIPENVGACNVRLAGRTLYKDGTWSTICLPFNLTLSGSVLDGDNVQLMTLGSTSLSDGTMSLNFVDADEIVAGKPYIIRWGNTGSCIDNPLFTDVTIVDASLEENAFTNKLISFKGVFSPFEITEGNNKMLYLGDDNQMYYPSTAMPVNAFRAYLILQGEREFGNPSSAE